MRFERKLDHHISPNLHLRKEKWRPGEWVQSHIADWGSASLPKMTWMEGGLTRRVTEFCGSLPLPLKWPVQQVQRLILAWPHYLCCPPPSSCPLCTHNPDLLAFLQHIKPAPAQEPSHTLTVSSAWNTLPSNSHICHFPVSCSQLRSALLLLNFQNFCETAINVHLNNLYLKHR